MRGAPRTIAVEEQSRADQALGLGAGTGPVAPVALTAVTGISVPAGSTRVFQAWLPDNQAAVVLLRVEAAAGAEATTTATAQRALVNTAKITVAGPCYVYPVLVELDGTAATATANDKLLISLL